MKREFLTELGIEVDKIDKIMAEHGKAVNESKSKVDESREEVKLLKEKVTSLEKTAKDTETLLKDNADLKSKYESLQSESKAALENKDKEISFITKKTALNKALAGKGAKYADLLMKEFDLEKIELDGENIKGFDDLLKPITEKYAEMFPKTEFKGQEPGKGEGQKEPGDIDLGFFDSIK